VPSRSELRDAEKLARAQAYGANTWKRHGAWMRLPWYAAGGVLVGLIWAVRQIDWSVPDVVSRWPSIPLPPLWLLAVVVPLLLVAFVSWRLRDEVTAMPRWIRVKHRVRRWLRRL